MEQTKPSTGGPPNSAVRRRSSAQYPYPQGQAAQSDHSQTSPLHNALGGPLIGMSPRELRRAVAIPERAQVPAPPSQRASAVCGTIKKKPLTGARGDRRPRRLPGGLFDSGSARGPLRQMRRLEALVINPGKIEGI